MACLQRQKELSEQMVEAALPAEETANAKILRVVKPGCLLGDRLPM
jgi:hypothetical protein